MTEAQSSAHPSTRLSQSLRAAESMLQPGEKDVPLGVQRTCAFFADRDIWFQLSRNPKVLSCRDAANRRYRLGYRGIPLADELRSYLTEGNDPGRQRVYVLFHCRGDSQVYFEKISEIEALRDLSLSRATLHEFDDESIGYGLINPFVAPELLADSGADVLQFFDDGLFVGGSETGSMMTNAGDKTWGVEFDPKDLLLPIRKGFGAIKSICSSPADQRRTRAIGILTGNAPESGALLWRKINRLARLHAADAFRGDISYPKVLVHSIPEMGWSMELSSRADRLRPIVLGEIAKMIDAGAEVIALACNTTQYYEDVIRKETKLRGVTFVGLPRHLDRWLAESQGQSTFVAGIGHVTSPSHWSAFPSLHQLEHVKLPDDRQSAMIDQLAYEIKLRGVTPRSYQKFRALARNCRASNMLLLLTELSMIFETFPRNPVVGTNVVDVLDLYAAAILEASLGTED